MSTKSTIESLQETAKSPLQQPPTPATSGLSVEILQQPVPKLPHEADQSTANQETEIRPEMIQAKRDIEAGLQDTGRLPVVNEVYKRQKK